MDEELTELSSPSPLRSRSSLSSEPEVTLDGVLEWEWEREGVREDGEREGGSKLGDSLLRETTKMGPSGYDKEGVLASEMDGRDGRCWIF